MCCSLEVIFYMQIQSAPDFSDKLLHFPKEESEWDSKRLKELAEQQNIWENSKELNTAFYLKA